MNKVILVGNLTRDPELQTTSSGVPVCRFSLAISRRYANAEGERGTDFINIIVWRNQAENCAKYLKKGSKVAITGSIQTGSYDAQDGTKRYVTDVVAQEVEFIGSRQSGDSQVGSKDEDDGGLTPIDDDTLPF